MAKAKAKTTETDESVTGFLNAIADEQRRNDCVRIAEIMTEQSGYEAKLWGANIIGFASYHYKYASGHEGDAPLVAFSPRKAAISLYLSANFENRATLLQKFGKHKSAKACIYVNKLEDINIDILKEMISASIKYTKSLRDTHEA